VFDSGRAALRARTFAVDRSRYQAGCTRSVPLFANIGCKSPQGTLFYQIL
jgi:hypothetical protein